MGEIYVEGLGIVEIAGDTPNEQETRAILEAIGGPDEEGDIFEPYAPTPTPPPSIPGELYGRPGAVPTGVQAGPLGLMPTETREKVRGAIEEQPSLTQLAIEASPSIAGAIKGGAMGAPAGPWGMLGGAMLGGLVGEVVAQETGMAPRSDVNLALGGGGPLIGVGVGKGVQYAKRGVGTAFTKAPFARVAHARNVISQAVEEFEGIGTRILAKQKGLMARPTQDLYAALRRAPIRIPSKMLQKTRTAIAQLEAEMQPLNSFPEVQQALGVLKNLRTSVLGKEEGALLTDVVRTRSLLGVAVSQAESVTRKAGVKFGAAKKAFGALADDMDMIAASKVGKTARQMKLAKAAIARAKLGFGIDELEGAVARYTKEIPEGMAIDAKGLLKWLTDVTNPKHSKFNKNFSQALKDEIPEIKTRLSELVKYTTGSPAGPGSIVIRGQTAKMGRALIGGLLGFGTTGGAIGAGAGAVAFAQLPEMVVAALTTKGGAQFLNAAAQLGRGQINRRAWMVLGQVMARMAGESEDDPKAKQLMEMYQEYWGGE